MGHATATSPSPYAGFDWVLVALVVIAAVVVRGRLLDCPLERDEGEYAYAGQLILQGIPPYQHAYNMKLPGTYVAFALLMAVFGQTTVGVHLGLAAVNSATIVLVFLLARRLYGSSAGVASAATFALLSAGTGVLGFAAHATHFVTVFAVGGTLALLPACDSGRRWQYFGAGLLFGLAVLMKQHGVLFALFAAGFASYRERNRSPRDPRAAAPRLAALTAGVVAPFGLTCLVLYAAGVFDRFWFWTFTYASEYASQVPPSVGWELFKHATDKIVAGPNWPLWLLAAAGLFLTWYAGERRHAVFVSGWLAISFLTVCPGFYFREHYFIVLLPAVSVLAGAVAGLGRRGMTRLGAGADVSAASPALLFAAALAWSVYEQADYLFVTSPENVIRTAYAGNPFVESVEIASYIKAHTTPEDRIAVIGSEPQIYFYSGRKSATGYIYTYPMMEPQPFADTMQQEMIAEIEAARPKYVVLVVIPTSWLARPGSSDAITRWADAYCRERYEFVGVVESDGSRSVSHWDAEAAGYAPRFPFVVVVGRRKG